MRNFGPTTVAFGCLLLLAGCPDDEPCTSVVDCAAGEACTEGECVPEVDEDEAVIRSFEASAFEVVAGTEVTLTWATLRATSCELAFADTRIDVECNASRDVTIDASTEFTLVAFGAGGDAQRIVRVSVVDGVDGGFDAGAVVDGGFDAGVDGGFDAGVVVDGGLDAGVVVDGGLDAGAVVDGGVDAGVVVDGGLDAGVVDGGVDAGVDGGVDAGVIVDGGGGLDAGPAEYVVSMSIGDGTFCAVSNLSRLKCFGSNFDGRLGLGDTLHRSGEIGVALPEVDLGGPVASVSLSSSFGCAVLVSGEVKCWGENDFGQLGLGDTESRGDEPDEMGSNLPSLELAGPAAEIHTGSKFGCALLRDGRVQCWGINQNGQLGLGDTETRGDEPGEMGGALPTVSIPLPVQQLSVGQSFVCVRLAGGSVRCWGRNSDGQLGLGSVENRGDDPDEMGDNLLPAILGSEAIDVTTGRVHVCVRYIDAQFRCFGGNESGQLGRGTTENIGDAAGEMETLTTVPLGFTSHQFTSASNANLILNDSDELFAFGGNPLGWLGVDIGGNTGDEPGELGALLPRVRLTIPIVKYWTSGFSHCAQAGNTSAIYCWGGVGAGTPAISTADQMANLQPTRLF